MDTATLVKKALGTLTAGDLEEHLSYLADAVVLKVETSDEFGEHIRGKSEYRAYIDEAKIGQLSTGFRLLSGAPSKQSGDRWIAQAILYVQTEVIMPDDTVVPADDPNSVHIVIEVDDQRITSMVMRPLRVYGATSIVSGRY